MDTTKALLRVLCQRKEYHFLHIQWDRRAQISQRRRGLALVLQGDLRRGSPKWDDASQPLKDHHTQRVLVAGWLGLTLDLLWSHVGNRAGHIACLG
jgi:hypothetical protein